MRNTGGAIIEENVNEDMNAIEELSSDEEVEDAAREVPQEPSEVHLDSAADAAPEELLQGENNEVFEMEEQNITANSLEAPGQEPWCVGGINEACGEYISCGRKNCGRCFQF